MPALTAWANSRNCIAGQTLAKVFLLCLRLAIWLSSFFVIGLLAFDSVSAQSGYDLTGSVRDDSGGAVAQATVSLLNARQSSVASAHTDAQGQFTSGGKLYWADRTTGSLVSAAFSPPSTPAGIATAASVTGPATVVDSANDWRARALFLGPR